MIKKTGNKAVTRRTGKTYVVKDIANALGKKSHVGCFTPYEKV